MKSLNRVRIFFAIGLLLSSSSYVMAQNYLPANALSGANVIVNMDVLDIQKPTPPEMTAPVTSKPLPPVSEMAPIALQKPSPSPVLKPIKPADSVQPIAKPELIAKPIIKKPVETKPHQQEKREPVLSAKELVQKTQREQEQKTKLPVPEFVVSNNQAKMPEPVQASADHQRELLATAHEAIPYEPKTTAQRPSRSIDDLIHDHAKVSPVPSPIRHAPIAVSEVEVSEISQPKKSIAMKTDKASFEMAALAPMPEKTMASPEKEPNTSMDMDISTQDQWTLLFEDGAAILSDQDTKTLDQIAQYLQENEALKIQLRAFADGTPETTSKARRLSLTRALTVRTYLLDQGVNATAMDVRALGIDKSAKDQSADRVDLIFIR